MDAHQLILTPSDPGFYEILYGTYPPGWQETSGGFAAFVVRHDRGGIMSAATDDELDEYLGGGEYDEVMDDENDLGESWLCIPDPEVGFFFTEP